MGEESGTCAFLLEMAGAKSELLSRAGGTNPSDKSRRSEGGKETRHRGDLSGFRQSTLRVIRPSGCSFEMRCPSLRSTVCPLNQTCCTPTRQSRFKFLETQIACRSPRCWAHLQDHIPPLALEPCVGDSLRSRPWWFEPASGARLVRQAKSLRVPHLKLSTPNREPFFLPGSLGDRG